jgi:hypothetical protein
VIATAAAINVQSLGGAETVTVRPLPMVPAPAVVTAQPPRPNRHTPSVVALTPDAMAALIEAQAHMAPGADMVARTQTIQRLGQIIARVSNDGSPPAPPQPEPAEGGFAMERLEAARDHLRETFA